MNAAVGHGTLRDVRIIAGEFRGRKLLGPEGDQTRPITDRAKQSLFDILSPMIEGAVVYDCFAGTGSMGLECLSRGAARVVFFERDRSAQGNLKRNILELGVDNRSVIVWSDIFRAFDPAEAGPADLVFLDPPYRFLAERTDDLKALARRIVAHLNQDGTVVFRHDASDNLELPELVRYDQRTYGSMMIELLRKKHV
jgi:16S rRNA (guanine966-N2)-methyltransferase